MKYIKVYTDGACKGNPGKGGWGFAIIDNNSPIICYYGGNESTTNNKMEITALIESIKELNKHNTEYFINLFTDSQYLINGCTKWIHGWSKSDWGANKSTTLKNIELWKEYYSLSRGKKIFFHWVKGHSGNIYNDLADKLANAGVLCPNQVKYFEIDRIDEYYIRSIKII